MKTYMESVIAWWSELLRDHQLDGTDLGLAPNRFRRETDRQLLRRDWIKTVRTFRSAVNKVV